MKNKNTQYLIAGLIAFFSVVIITFKMAMMLKKRFESEEEKIEPTIIMPSLRQVKPKVKIKTEVKKIVKKINKKASKFSGRQEKILSVLRKSTGNTPMEEIQKVINDVHVRTLRRDLAELERKGIVKKFGQTKGVHYRMVI